MANLSLEIVTPQAKVFSGEIKSVNLPGGQSPFQVLTNHAPVVSSLVKGNLKIENMDGSIKLYETSNGFVELANNKVSVVVESAKLV